MHYNVSVRDSNNLLGALAQLVARNVRNVEVRGSNPLCSTKHNKRIADGYPFVFLVKSRVDLKGTARQGKKASGGWLFSSPGWRQDCPSLAGNPLCSTKHNKRIADLNGSYQLTM